MFRFSCLCFSRDDLCGFIISSTYVCVWIPLHELPLRPIPFQIMFMSMNMWRRETWEQMPYYAVYLNIADSFAHGECTFGCRAIFLILIQFFFFFFALSSLDVISSFIQFHRWRFGLFLFVQRWRGSILCTSGPVQEHPHPIINLLLQTSNVFRLRIVKVINGIVGQS